MGLDRKEAFGHSQLSGPTLKHSVVNLTDTIQLSIVDLKEHTSGI